MKKVFRIVAAIAAVLIIGVVLLGGWFYTTIPEAPSPPADLAQTDSAQARVELPEVRDELLRMRWVDQTVREQGAELFRSGDMEGVGNLLEALRYYFLESRVDEKNTARLKELVAEHGWLHEGRVGHEGADAAFLIAQHADHDIDFQREVLAYIKDAHDRGEATGQQVALLTDRVRVAEGQPQLYGTQAQMRNGEVVFRAIQDSSDVNQRRSEMGLPSLSEYAERLREEFKR
jgi:hypothetical protein